MMSINRCRKSSQGGMRIENTVAIPSDGKKNMHRSEACANPLRFLCHCKEEFFTTRWSRTAQIDLADCGVSAGEHGYLGEAYLEPHAWSRKKKAWPCFNTRLPQKAGARGLDI